MILRTINGIGETQWKHIKYTSAAMCLQGPVQNVFVKGNTIVIFWEVFKG